MSVKDFENARWNAFAQKREFRHTAALSLIQEGPVLDIGCGDGLFLSMCKEKGIEAQGVDLSDAAVTRCTERGLRATLTDSISNPLPFRDGEFTTVVALDVLEHVYTPETLLAEMSRVSRKNVIIGVPNFSSLPARLQTVFGRVPENNRPNKGHVYWFNWPVLQSLVERGGFRVTKRAVNGVWGSRPIIGGFLQLLAEAWPNLFALSFVIVCEKH